MNSKQYAYAMLAACGTIGLFSATSSAYLGCPQASTTNKIVCCSVLSSGPTLNGCSYLETLAGNYWVNVGGDTPLAFFHWRANGFHQNGEIKCTAATPFGQGTTTSEPCGPFMSRTDVDYTWY